jgi:hypothetical protein
MQTQTQSPTQSPSTQSQDVLQQFSDMLKSHSIVVHDRENLIKLFENIVELCTQTPKPKLKAAVKAAKEPAPAKESKDLKNKPNPRLKKPVAAAAVITEDLVGPTDAGDCPMLSDLKPVALARGRGRPRKNATAAVETVATVAAVAAAATTTTTPVGEAEKKKRGRPKKDKSVMISSNEDEDALIAKMIEDVRSMKNDARTPVAIADPDDDETDTDTDEISEISVSPIHTEMVGSVGSEAPIQVEMDVPVPVPVPAVPVVTKKLAKAPKAPKEPKAAAKPKAATKEPKAAAKPKAAKQAVAVVVMPVDVASDVASVLTASSTPSIPAPLSENNASSDGKIYLTTNFPRVSFTHSGQTYFRTETDNVYDNMTLELIGVWDHLNHEIITAFDDEEVEELWFSDEE